MVAQAVNYFNLNRHFAKTFHTRKIFVMQMMNMFEKTVIHTHTSRCQNDVTRKKLIGKPIKYGYRFAKKKLYQLSFLFSSLGCR